MWSFRQYRTIGKQVEREWRQKTRQNTTAITSPDIENGELKQPESPTHPREAQSQSQSQGHEEEKSISNADSTADNEIIVECMTDDDPFDPRNWPLLSRAKNIAILCLLIFVQAWVGASESMANSQASKEFHVSQTAENLSTAMYLFGIGSGCLFVGPLSETIGRNPTYLTSTFGYLFFVLGTALVKNFAGQIVCRYFVGLFSSATLGINGASVRDQFRPVKRAFVFPVIAWANVVRKYLLLEYRVGLTYRT
jgi:hypothetical protein